MDGAHLGLKGGSFTVMGGFRWGSCEKIGSLGRLGLILNQ